MELWERYASARFDFEFGPTTIPRAMFTRFSPLFPPLIGSSNSGSKHMGNNVIPRDGTTDEQIEALLDDERRNPKRKAVAAWYISASDVVAVRFDNGIEIRFPRAQIDGLADATVEQLSAIVIEGAIVLAWPLLGDDVASYIPNMMEGFEPSCRAAAAEMGRRGGAKKSPEKPAAVRANDKKGGRPRKAVARAKAS